MIQLNLLPDVKKDLLHSRRQRNVVISVCIFVSIASGTIVLILGGVLGGQTIQKNLLTDSIKSSTKEINNKQSDDQLDEYLTVQNQLSKIDSLKNKQMIYSRLFNYLKELNPASPNSVRLSSVKVATPSSSTTATTVASTSTNIVIEMQGVTGNYQSLGVFEATLSMAKLSYAEGEGADVQTKPFFISVVTSATSLSKSNELDFTIKVECDKAVFDPNSVNMKLTIPSETTSDSDRNTPQNVFDSSSSNSSTTKEAQ